MPCLLELPHDVVSMVLRAANAECIASLAATSSTALAIMLDAVPGIGFSMPRELLPKVAWPWATANCSYGYLRHTVATAGYGTLLLRHSMASASYGTTRSGTLWLRLATAHYVTARPR